MAISKPTTQPRRTTDRALPVCPECGGLECLCRPRFFAGQLLTEQDLNRLDRYILDKNRLHNRYLHGAGVVCGLEVVCHPCEGYVTVRAGYALSPCGDDIIVCDDDDVNVCDLLDRCRPRDDRDYPCDPPRPQRADDCRDVEEDWILVVCFEERPSRGVMALRASGPTCARCGSRDCEGGCSQPKNGHTRTQSYRNQPAQCEPTVMCETYHFELRRAPTLSRSDSSRVLQGEMAQRILACINEARDSLPPFPTDTSRASLFRWCCQVKAALEDLLVRQGVYDCLADDRLARVRCPDPSQFESDSAYLAAVQQAVVQMALAAVEILRACLCSALLPPCPPPSEDNCVPLATLTIRRSDCKILRVCNITNRQFAITVPALLYWLSIFPIGQQLRQLLARLCCAPSRRDPVTVGGFERRVATPASFEPRGAAASPRASTAATGFTAKASQPYATLFAQAWTGRQRIVDPATILLDALGAVDLENRPFVSDTERNLPAQAIWLNQLVAPILEQYVPGAAETDVKATPAADVEALRAEVAELRALVREQSDTIEAMRKRRRG